MKKVIIIILIVVGTAWFLIDDAVRKLPPLSSSQMMMDTIITVKAYGSHHIAEKALTDAFNAFKEVEEQVSCHIASSSLSMLNTVGYVKKEGHLVPVTELCLQYERITDGYFDPSFYSLNKLYGFYGDVPSSIPTEFEIQEVLRSKTMLSRVLTSGKDFYALKEGAKLDFGGAAGGYAISLAAEAMKKAGCNTFLIDDAGDILVNGTKPDGTPWKIAVKSPYDNSVFALAEITSGQALSTSGNYERFVEINGVKYGHIMNPSTGRPADDFSSITVIADNPTEADIMSTALFAMPYDKSIKKANDMKMPVLFVTSDKRIIISDTGKSMFKLLKTEL